MSDDAPRSTVFRDMTVGLGLGVFANGVAVVLCALAYAIPLAVQLSVPGVVGEVVGLLGLFGLYWAMGFSVVQVVYLGPLGLIATLRGRPGVALGLVITAVVTFLLQLACVAAGIGLLAATLASYGH